MMFRQFQKRLFGNAGSGDMGPIAVITIAHASEYLQRPVIVPRIEALAEELRRAGLTQILCVAMGVKGRPRLAMNCGVDVVPPKRLKARIGDRDTIFVDQEQYHVAHEWVTELLEKARGAGEVYLPEPSRENPPNHVNHLRLKGLFLAVPGNLSPFVADMVAQSEIMPYHPEAALKECRIPYKIMPITPKTMPPIYRRATELEKPVSFIVEANSTCNYHCLMCHFHGGRQKKGPYYIKPGTPVELPLEKFKSVIDQITGLERPCEDENTHIRIMPYWRGEFLLHSQWREALAYIKSKGLGAYFSTNGSNWTDKDIDFVIDVGLDLLQVSINGHNMEVHRRLRLNDEFDKPASAVMKIIKRRHERGLDKPQIQVCNIFNDRTQGEIDTYVDYWLEKVDRIFMSPENYMYGADHNKRYMSEYSEHPMPDPDERPACGFVRDYLHIDASGDSRLCFGAKKVSTGNVFDIGVEGLLNAPERRAVIAAHAEGDYTSRPCTHCEQWHGSVDFDKEETEDYVKLSGPARVNIDNKNPPVIIDLAST